jgi:hypothetical protein
MSSTDFNMLRLEAPRPILQFTDGTDSTAYVEIASPATWVRCLVCHQVQAERHLRQLYEERGNHFDRSDQRIVAIERAYNEFLNGAQYVYEQTQSNARISEEWIRTELATTANAYHTFSQQVWEGIAATTTNLGLQQAHQGTQLAHLHNTLAFQLEANITRSQHLVKFQGDVTFWATRQTARTEKLEEELRRAKKEISHLATLIPVPASHAATPLPPTFLQGPNPLASPFRGTAGEAGGGGSPPRRSRPPARTPSTALRTPRQPTPPCLWQARTTIFMFVPVVDG